MTRDFAASVKARLLNRAKKTGERYELSLVRYACERFLYRLGASELRHRYILKGATLLSLWMLDPYRPTRDIDLLAYGNHDEASVRVAMHEICGISCPEDGLLFDLESLAVSQIRADQNYPGQRAVLRAFLGETRIRIQADFGFGDAVIPAPAEVQFPTLLDNVPPPRLHVYPPETTIAEKYQAMLTLGRQNSRMKDFHDIWALSEIYSFKGSILCEAIKACFDRRGTMEALSASDAESRSFYLDADLQARWGAYLRRGQFLNSPPLDFEDIGERIRTFLGPIRESILAEVPFDLAWSAGGSWQTDVDQNNTGRFATANHVKEAPSRM